MPNSKRCVFGCVTKGLTVHCFPNPVKFAEQFQAWVDICGKRLKNVAVEDIYPRMKVCDRHFIHSHRNRNNRLNALAIPTLHITQYRSCNEHNYFALDDTNDDAADCTYVTGKNDGTILHTFPNPKKDIETFKIWMQAVGTTLTSLEPTYILKNRRICHIHFEPKYLTWGKRLCQGAIPTLFLTDNASESNENAALPEMSTCILINPQPDEQMPETPILPRQEAKEEIQFKQEPANQISPSKILRVTRILTKPDHTHSKTMLPRKVLNEIHNCALIPDERYVPRAQQSLPNTLRLRRGLVAPRRRLRPRVCFGPVAGISTVISKRRATELVADAAKSKNPVYLLQNEDMSITHIDVTDEDKSNWFNLLTLGDKDTANVWLHQENNMLYGFTTDSIPAGTTLKLGYSQGYAKVHGMPPGLPILDLDEELSKPASTHWCEQCYSSFKSLAQLEAHNKAFHQESVSENKGRYRCKNCTKRFATLFCLKRHKTLHCRHKRAKTPEIISTTQIQLNSTEENTSRIPSDESLQNYTNILDISTNLFDTDRISALDISGGKSENEYNLYESKDDNRLPGVFDFVPTELTGLDFSEKTKKSKEKIPSLKPVPFTCPYCKLTLPRNKLKQHSRVCSGRKFDCVCGSVFGSKTKLSEHIQTTHRSSTPNVEQENNVSDGMQMQESEQLYTCPICNLNFKRRGMYVNHMSRSHRQRSTAPLVVPSRRYVCPLCEHVYHSAAKRDAHFVAHHPGKTLDRKSCVITGQSRTMAPAVCAYCPRQYATKYKLTQHIRQKHNG